MIFFQFTRTLTLLLGIVALIATVFVTVTLFKHDKYRPAKGVVVAGGCVVKGWGSHECELTVRYTDANGQVRVGQLKRDEMFYKFGPGDDIPVRYNIEQPDTLLPGTGLPPKYLFPIFFGSFAVALVMYGAGVIFPGPSPLERLLTSKQ